MALARNLVLVRHGQSATNAANVFTGWSDPPLTDLGREEGRALADRLKREGLLPDRIFCSPLQRCAETARIIMAGLVIDLPVRESADLNERDYGALNGQNKDEAARAYGAEQVRRWRRSYAEAPPGGESLRDTAARVLRCYIRDVLPATMAGGTTLVVSSGNALRSLVMTLDGLDATEIEHFGISTGAILHYQLGADSRVERRSILHNEVLTQ